MRLALIAAVAENGVIGRDNALPWYLPEDLAHFKRVTLGKPVVMGRHTFESIGRPLPGRTNIVVSRRDGFRAGGCEVAASLDEALELAGRAARREGVDEVVVIGGEKLYAAALPRADRLYLTEVHAAVEGDVNFPAVDWSQWIEIERVRHSAAEPDSGKGLRASGDRHEFSIVVYERRRAGDPVTLSSG